MSDTPRTDADVWLTRTEVDDPTTGWTVLYEAVVDADLARKLERELSAMQKQRDEALDIAATHKRNWYEAKTEYGTALGKVRAELAAALKQRDEAREELEGLIAYRAVVALNKEGGGA